MAINRAVIGILDYYKKRGTIRVNTTVVTAGNFAAQDTALGAFVSAVTAVTLGNVLESYVDTMLTQNAVSYPTDQNASRADKWLVRFTDQINGRKGSFEIPAADRTLLAANQPFLDLTGGAGATLKTNSEAYVKSVDGNAITVDSVEYVPRKS